MQDVHREAIQRNFSSLVERTDLDVMVSSLYEKGVFSEAMIEPYKDPSKDARMRKRLLYMDLPRRGPDAFRNLLDALMEIGQWDLVRELDPSGEFHQLNIRSQQNRIDESNFRSLRRNRPPNDSNANRPAPGPSAHIPPKDAVPEGVVPKPPEEAVPGPARPEAEPAPIPQFNVIKSTHFFEDDGNSIKLYRTRGRNRGVLVLFSYLSYEGDMEKARKGAEVDALNLRYLFSELGFKVLAYTNLSHKDTITALSSLKYGICGEGPETVFIVFSSHGYPRAGTGDYDIRCSDHGLLSYYTITEYFNSEKFPALNNIPKVFIFQSCRGQNSDTVLHLREPHAVDGEPIERDGARSRRASECDGQPTDRPAPRSAHGFSRTYSDILIAHSTVPGFVSRRDPEKGSWYIQALCDVFAARAHDTHVEDLFTLVDKRLHAEHLTQTSSVDRWGFNRRLYLHPGLYED